MERRQWNRAQKRQLKKMRNEGFVSNLTNVDHIKQTILSLRAKIIENPTSYDRQDIIDFYQLLEEITPAPQMTCVVHKQDIEVWYDCDRCLEESVKWSKERGFNNSYQWASDNSRRHKLKVRKFDDKQSTAITNKINRILQKLDPTFCWLRK